MTLGERIRYARKHRKYTQLQLADMIGAKHNSISGWENNNHLPDVDSLERICEVLNIRPNWILGKDNIMIDDDNELHVTDIEFHEINPIDASFDAVSDCSTKLLEIYQSLNQKGKDKLIDYASDLINLTKYKKGE